MALALAHLAYIYAQLNTLFPSSPLSSLCGLDIKYDKVSFHPILHAEISRDRPPCVVLPPR